MYRTAVITGMRDKKDDIQMLTHLMLVRLVNIMPTAVLNSVFWDWLRNIGPEWLASTFLSG
jgi:hypothetical protein